MVGILPFSSRHTYSAKITMVAIYTLFTTGGFHSYCYTDAVQREVKIKLPLTCVAVHCNTYFYESQRKWKVFHKYFKQDDSKFESMYPLFIYLL